MPPVEFAGREPLTTVLRAADGVAISAHHDPPHEAAADAGTAFVVAHGFTGSWRTPQIRAVVDVLRRRGGVVSFDFRGHGSSGGLSTLGDAEVLDVDAAVAWARGLGHPRVVTLGWSMGAAVVIRHAALCRGVDAVVAASGPSRWHYQGSRPMRTVHRAVRSRLGRWVLATRFRTRVGTFPRNPPPEPPDAVAGRIAPTPLLVVHGDADHYFPLEHAQWLALAAGPTGELWIEHGFTHAERGAPPELVSRIADWAVTARASAKMPG
jgi:pimeloyl-ACP methyl ester carboxylesterase